MAYKRISPQPVVEGGTGAQTLTNHAVLIGQATSAIVGVGPVASTGCVLQSNGAASDPGFSTATYPITSTINQLLYSSAANTIVGLTTANNGTLVTSAAGVPSILAGPGTTGNILQSNAAAAPSFSTATYPSVATGTGTILRADVTNWVATTATYPATTTVSQILYSSSANVVGGITTANNGTLVTSNTGVPSILAGPGTTGNILQSNAAAAPSFSTATYPSVATGTGTILRADGTNWVATTATYPATTTINQVLYSSAANTVAGITAANNGVLISSATGVPSWLAAGTTGQVLTATTGSPPSWGAAGGTGDVVGPGSATDNAITRFDLTTGKLIQNSTVTIDDTGNISDSNSAAGATLSMTLSNTSNTASSNALHQVTVAGTSAGDAFTTYTVSGTTNWSVGVDNSASDAFVVAASNALGTTNVMSVGTSGEVTFPLQSAFYAYLGTADSNVTGDSTAYTLGSGNALTEVYDRNSDFATSGTFTAPVTGIYQLGMNIQFSGLTSSHTLGYLQIVTSSATYVFNLSNPWAVNYANTLTWSATVNAPMTASNTATFQLIVGGGTKVVDITAINGYTYVYGHLIC